MDPAVWHPIFLCVLVVAVFVSFVREWFSPDLTAMAALVLIAVSGILPPDEALSVFAHPAPIAVACMFILSAALERTGVIEVLGNRFERMASGSELKILILMMLLVAPLSGFMNNTPVVVVFLPVIIALARKKDMIASRFLIPLSYAAIAGGTCTLIGTSTNLVAKDMAEDTGLEQLANFNMFEVTPLGIVFVVVVVIYMSTIGRRLLPDRVTLATLFESGEGKEFLTQAVISPDSPLIRKTLPETPLAKMKDIRIIEVRRAGAPVRTRLDELEFEPYDKLVLKTRLTGVVDMEETEGLDIGIGDQLGLDSVQTDTAVLMEGILGPQSTLVGKSLKKVNLRQLYGVIILAVHRRGVNIGRHFEKVNLAVGDTLLVQGPVESMNRLFSERRFINLSQATHRPYRRSKGPIALGAIGLLMLLGALNAAPIAVLALAATLLVIMTRCIEPADAYQAVEWRVIFMIIGMLGLGLALDRSGTAALLAGQVTDWLGGYGPWVMLSAVYLLTALLTEVISNNAVAALMTPVAISMALAMPGEVDPRPFVIAVMFGSSASFSTPIGYQTNTYVFGAGGYKFTDFARVGVPLALILWIIASFLIPVLWPF